MDFAFQSEMPQKQRPASNHLINGREAIARYRTRIQRKSFADEGTKPLKRQLIHVVNKDADVAI